MISVKKIDRKTVKSIIFSLNSSLIILFFDIKFCKFLSPFILIYKAKD